jgi:hypothetical protein
VDANGPSYAVYDDRIAIGLLPGNVPAIAYPNATAISWANRAGGTWSTEAIRPFGSYTDMSMEIDGTGAVRLNYWVAFGTQEYAVRTNGSWSRTGLAGWGVLPRGFPSPATIAAIGYTGLNDPMPLQMLRQSAGTFVAETVDPSLGDGSSIDAALLQRSGLTGTISLLVGGYRAMRLYQRCAFP